LASKFLVLTDTNSIYDLEQPIQGRIWTIYFQVP
jgi:hypothetical protein